MLGKLSERLDRLGRNVDKPLGRPSHLASSDPAEQAAAANRFLGTDSRANVPSEDPVAVVEAEQLEAVPAEPIVIADTDHDEDAAENKDTDNTTAVCIIDELMKYISLSTLLDLTKSNDVERDMQQAYSLNSNPDYHYVVYPGEVRSILAPSHPSIAEKPQGQFIAAGMHLIGAGDHEDADA